MTHPTAQQAADVSWSQTSQPHEQPKPDIFDHDKWRVSSRVDIEPQPIEFVVNDLFPRGFLTLVVGGGGDGKTGLLHQTSLCTAGGAALFGLATLHGPSYTLLAEDCFQLIHARERSICDMLKLDMRDANSIIVPQTDDDVCLWRNGKPTLFLESVERKVRDMKAVFLGLDSASLLYEGKMNELEVVAPFMVHLNKMAARLNCTVALAHHSSKSDDGSAKMAALGSVAWINQARHVIRMQKGDDDAVSLEIIKSNVGQTGLKLDLQRDGCTLLRHVGDAHRHNPRAQRAETVFMSLLQEGIAQGRIFSDSNRASNFAPKVFASKASAEGLKRKDFEVAMERLFDKGRIIMNEHVGPDRHKRAVIMVAGGSCAGGAGRYE